MRPTFTPAFIALLLAVSPAGAQPEHETEPEPATIAPLASRALLIDAAAVGTAAVVVGAYGNVLRVGDGLRWTQSPVPVRNLLTAVYFVDERTGWAVGHDAAILRTDDGGASWRLQHFAPELEQPLFDVLFVDDDTGFAVGAYGLMLRTDDGGDTWDEVDYTDDPDSHLNAIVQLGDGTLLVVGERGAAFRSTDGGEGWEALEFPYEGSMFGAVVNDGGDRVIAFGLRGRVFVSDDAGDSWREAVVRADLSLMGGARLEDGRIVLVGMNGLVLVSTDDGDSFERYRHPDGDALSGVFELDGGLVVVGESGLAPLDLDLSVLR